MSQGSSPQEQVCGILGMLFPFGFSVGEDLRILMHGPRWETNASRIEVGDLFTDRFVLERPVGFGLPEAFDQHDAVFLLRMREWPEFQLRGQFVAVQPGGVPQWMFIGGPWVTHLEQLSRLGLEFHDFPPHDARGDFLVLLQLQGNTLDDMKQLTNRLRASTTSLEARTREMEHEMGLRARLEEQLRHSQKMEAVGRLAGGVAHDFNNILSVIQGYTALVMSRTAVHDPSRESLETIYAAAERAAGLTRQLLAFSRQQVLRPMSLDVRREVLEVEQLLRPLLGRSISLEVALDTDAGHVWADASAIHQIVMNLAINARDAMPDGGRLSIRLVAVPGAGIDPGVLEISVTDTGTGMDEETRARIFEPFFTTKQVGKGSGLGLSIVYGLVEQCGGRIDVESEPGQGTTFRVCLPRTLVDEVEAAAQERAGSDAGTGERILIVEDDLAVKRLVEQILSESGYWVTSFGSPAEALEGERLQCEFDLLLTDMIMPDMRGTELVRRIEERCGPVAALFVSGYTGEQAMVDTRLQPRQRFLQKPFAPQQLLAVVRELLDSTRVMRESGSKRA